MGNGFKTPEGYFEGVEDSIFTKLSVQQFPEKEGFDLPLNYLETVEERVLKTIVNDTNLKKESLNIPEGYFDTIEDRVFKKIQQDTIEQPKVINLKSRLIKVIAPIAIAASLLLMIVLNNNSDGYTIEDLAASDIEEWLEDDLISFDSYEIAEVYHDVSLENEFSTDDLEVLNYVNGTDIESVLLTD